MVLLSTIISFVNCSLHFLYRKYWIFRTYNFTCSLISHINVSIEVSFIWHRRFVHCVGFLTMSSLLWRPKKLTFYTGFYSKSLHSPLCSVAGIIYLLRSQPKDKAINEQLGASCFADTFRTAEKTNLISLWSEDSLNASLWRHIRCFRISKNVTSLLSVCKVLYHSM